MAAEYAGIRRCGGPAYVLHMHVENAVAKAVDKLYVVDALVAEMARVVVETEGWMTVECFDGPFGRGDIEGDFRRVHFERKLDAELLKLIQDRRPALGKVLIAFVDHRG